MIYDLAIEAETVQKNLESDINALEKAYRDKARNVAQETLGTVLKSILSTDPPFLATLPKCNKNLKLFDNKVAGSKPTAGPIRARLRPPCNGAATWKSSLSELSDKKARKAYDKLVKARESLDKSLNDCSGMMRACARPSRASQRWTRPLPR